MRNLTPMEEEALIHLETNAAMYPLERCRDPDIAAALLASLMRGCLCQGIARVERGEDGEFIWHKNYASDRELSDILKRMSP